MQFTWIRTLSYDLSPISNYSKREFESWNFIKIFIYFLGQNFGRQHDFRLHLFLWSLQNSQPQRFSNLEDTCNFNNVKACCQTIAKQGLLVRLKFLESTNLGIIWLGKEDFEVSSNSLGRSNTEPNYWMDDFLKYIVNMTSSEVVSRGLTNKSWNEFTFSYHFLCLR